MYQFLLSPMICLEFQRVDFCFLVVFAETPYMLNTVHSFFDVIIQGNLYRELHAGSLVSLCQHGQCGAAPLPWVVIMARIIIHSPFIAVPLISTSSSLNVQYGHISCYTSALFDGQPYIIYFFRFSECISFSAAFCRSFTAMHVGMSGVASVAFVLNCRPNISMWVFLDIQSVMYRSGLGL